jgi:hypothetical protein
MAYVSGEFFIPNCGDRQGRSVVVFDQQLHVVGFGPSLIDTVFDLRQLPVSGSGTGNSPTGTDAIDTHALTNPTNWITTTVDGQQQTGCAAATDDAIYVFSWVGDGFVGGVTGSLQARRFSRPDADQPYAWGPALRPRYTEGSPFEIDGQAWSSTDARIGVTALNGKLLVSLVTGLSGSWIPLLPGPGPDRLLVALLDPSVIDESTGQWSATTTASVTPEELTVFDVVGTMKIPVPGYTGFGTLSEIEWFSSCGDSGDLTYQLAVDFCPTGGEAPGGQSARALLPITVSAAGDVTLAGFAAPIEATLQTSGPQSSLRRDPAGRLRSYCLRPGATLDPLSLLWPTVAADPQTGQPSLTAVPLTLADTSVPPAGAFHIFLAGATTSRTGNATTTSYPVLDFTLAGNTRGQLNLYGTIETVQVKAAPTQKNPLAPIRVISGIIDGPIPLPAVNFAAAIKDTEAGRLTYGNTDTSSSERTVANSWTAGFETSGHMSKGVGPAWDISLDGGMGTVTGSVHETSTSSSMLQATTYKIGSHAHPGEVEPYGSIQTSTAQVAVTAYRFLDPDGRPVNDATSAAASPAPKVALVTAALSGSSDLSYTPYSVEPGDLTSYTAPAWNARMKALGEPYANYYGDVVCANAFPFSDPDTPYLEYTWTEGSSQSAAYDQLIGNFTENSWTLDLSAYAGVSFGVGFSLFGEGAELEGEFLAGATYSHEATTTENQQTKWSIELEPGWGPPTSDLPASVRRYVYRLFFLPVPVPPSTLPRNAWTVELRRHLKPGDDTSAASIDPQSCCWKIVFVVTEIDYRDPKRPSYQHDPALDRISIYPPGGPSHTAKT